MPGFSKWKDYFVGPKVGKELRTKAYWAIGAALTGIVPPRGMRSGNSFRSARSTTSGARGGRASTPPVCYGN